MRDSEEAASERERQWTKGVHGGGGGRKKGERRGGNRELAGTAKGDIEIRRSGSRADYLLRERLRRTDQTLFSLTYKFATGASVQGRRDRPTSIYARLSHRIRDSGTPHNTHRAEAGREGRGEGGKGGSSPRSGEKLPGGGEQNPEPPASLQVTMERRRNEGSFFRRAGARIGRSLPRRR